MFTEMEQLEIEIMVRVSCLISNFYARNHISGTTEARVAKFCVLTEYVKCQPSDDRLPLIGLVRIT